MPKIIELRQDRSFIEANFDGYKLSLDSLPVIRQELSILPLQAKASDEQYSYLDVEIFALQNHLQQDPWNRFAAYFIDAIGKVFKCAYDESTGRPAPLQTVYKVPNIGTRQTGNYNVVFQFISEKYAVLCDGGNKILLIDTGDRYKGIEWNTIFDSEVPIEGENFLLRDSRLDIVEGRKVVSLALQRVHRSGEVHVNQLFCVVLKNEADTWIVEKREMLEGKGSIYYCAFEPKAGSIIVASNTEFKLESKLRQVVNEIPEDKAEEKETNEEFKFSWTQTDEDISVTFDKVEGKSKSDCSVTCTKTRLSVKCAENCLLDKELFGKVDSDLTTWSWENNHLKVTLIKDPPSLVWPLLVAGGPPESMDADNNSIPLENQAIPNLEAPIEECDFPMGTAEDDFCIERINFEQQETTHKVILGNSPPLFTTRLRPGFPPALVTRQDVDACVWLQQFSPAKADEWNLRHEGNLPAFGYVQASKQQKKFMDCSPDLSFAVICESHRHVFIYKSKNESAEGLRNRNGPQVRLGKQHLVTLDDSVEVLGMAIDSNVVTLLTEKAVLFLQINC